MSCILKTKRDKKVAGRPWLTSSDRWHQLTQETWVRLICQLALGIMFLFGLRQFNVKLVPFSSILVWQYGRKQSHDWLVLWRDKCFVCHNSGHKLDAVWSRHIQALLTETSSGCWLRLTSTRIVLSVLYFLWSHWPWFHWNKVSHLSVGEGRGKLFWTSICLGKANRPSFIDVHTCTSAEMQLESLWRDYVP